MRGGVFNTCLICCAVCQTFNSRWMRVTIIFSECVASTNCKRALYVCVFYLLSVAFSMYAYQRDLLRKHRAGAICTVILWVGRKWCSTCGGCVCVCVWGETTIIYFRTACLLSLFCFLVAWQHLQLVSCTFQMSSNLKNTNFRVSPMYYSAGLWSWCLLFYQPKPSSIRLTLLNTIRDSSKVACIVNYRYRPISIMIKKVFWVNLLNLQTVWGCVIICWVTERLWFQAAEVLH